MWPGDQPAEQPGLTATFLFHVCVQEAARLSADLFRVLIEPAKHLLFDSSQAKACPRNVVSTFALSFGRKCREARTLASAMSPTGESDDSGYLIIRTGRHGDVMNEIELA